MKWIYGAVLSAAVVMGGGSAGFGQDAKGAGKLAADQGGGTYRLTYTLTESDGAKRVGVQHFSMTITSTAHTTSVKLGSKVPVASGLGQSTQFTYMDVGLNIRAQVSVPETNGRVTLDSQVEQSGVGEPSVANTAFNQPVIRQTSLQNTAQLTLGKPMVLGSLDTPGSTRHLDVEVVLELVK